MRKNADKNYGRDRMSDDELSRTDTGTICARFGISRQLVWQWRVRRGLPTRGPIRKSNKKHRIDKYLGTEMTALAIAQLLNVSTSLVYYRARDTGVPTRKSHNPALIWGRNRVSDEELAAQTNRVLARHFGIKDSVVGRWRKVRGIPSPKPIGWALGFAVGGGRKRILRDVPDEELFGTSRSDLSEKYGCCLQTVTLERRWRRKHGKA